ncbi:hypothetical protein SLS59_003052 [Nothophoma quercina]|uniref:Tyrosyl-DNA phosphodiesterase 1 n=1 Tax=Nothophoma quercina TaxID=749835 RepID=A0ABR3RNC3_9PLEO
MISKDWTNMTQAVWRSPLLPLSSDSVPNPGPHAIGSGNRFQVDLLRYLSNYEKRLRRLTEQLVLYDFSAVRAAFLGSAPSRQVASAAKSTPQTSLGWLGLQQILRSEPRQEAHRGPAAPHIKTYIRFKDTQHKSIDWALLTSANLSKQAWGDVVNKQGEVRIQSYETGVLVWPDLFAEPGCEVSMVPTFGKDVPEAADVAANTMLDDKQGVAKIGDGEDDEETEDENGGDETEDENEPVHNRDKARLDGSNVPVRNDKKEIVVGLRMPYDLPLSSYSATDKPWCATQQYTEPDWKGRAWGGFHPR